MKNLIIRQKAAVIIFILIFSGFPLFVQAQTNSDGSSPQFLFPDFTVSKIRMNNGTDQSIKLNYNIVSEKMVYQKDGNLYDMLNIEMIDTVYLNDHKFVPVSKVFYEVLLKAPVTLYVQHKGGIIPPGTPAGYGGTSQVASTTMLSSVTLSSGYYNLKLPSDYIVKADPVYWIRKDSAMYNFINEKQFLKILPDKAAELKQFIKQNRIKFDKVPNLVRLITYYNELIR